MKPTTPSTDPAIIGMMLLIERLRQSNQPLGAGTIVPFAEMKLPRVAEEYEALVQRLLAEKLITGSAETFTLTAAGAELSDALTGRHSLHAWFYNEYYQAIQHSPAHSLFCERAYGKDLGQHGMADMEQLQALLTGLEVEAGHRLLDFGCGDGQMAEYIAEATGASVTGVDIAPEAIRIANERTAGKRDRVRFQQADIEREPGSFPEGRFEYIAAIDSLFLVRDQGSVTQALLGRLEPGGRMGVFYICPPGTRADETSLGQALDGMGVEWHAQDFSEQNRVHWIRKKQVLLELESRFRAEGSLFLFRNRMAECEGVMEKFQRYLYWITEV
jgi:SAM-dependent methyltransferase